MRPLAPPPHRGGPRWLWIGSIIVAVVAVVVVYVEVVGRRTERVAADEGQRTDTESGRLKPVDPSAAEPAPLDPAAGSRQIPILRRFPAPGRHPGGIAWDGSWLWTSDNSGNIFRLDTAGKTGGVYASPEVTPEGLVWDGSSFWIFTTNYSHIFQFRLEQGRTKAMVISDFKSPNRIIGGTSDDLAWDGENLWYADQFALFRLDDSGNVLSSFAFPKEIAGLTADGSNLWTAYNQGASGAVLSVLNTKGEILASHSSPVARIESLAWGDGGLWVLGRDSLVGEAMIYLLNVSRHPSYFIQ